VPTSRTSAVTSMPKIELHVHLEGTVRPPALLEIASRNGVALPVDTIDALAGLYRFTDFDHFIELWTMTTHAIRTEADWSRSRGVTRPEVRPVRKLRRAATTTASGARDPARARGVAPAGTGRDRAR
jgi:hypothetical protein